MSFVFAASNLVASNERGSRKDKDIGIKNTEIDASIIARIVRIAIASIFQYHADNIPIT